METIKRLLFMGSPSAKLLFHGEGHNVGQLIERVGLKMFADADKTNMGPSSRGVRFLHHFCVGSQNVVNVNNNFTGNVNERRLACSQWTQSFLSNTQLWPFRHKRLFPQHLRTFSTLKCMHIRHVPTSPKASFSTKKPVRPIESGILEDRKSALQVRKLIRKKAPTTFPEDIKGMQMNTVIAYAVGEEINLSALVRHIQRQGLYQMGDLPSDVKNAIHIRGKYNVEAKPKEIFIFEDGTAVFWCVSEVERSDFLRVVAKYTEDPYVTSLMLYEREEMDFAYTQGKSSLQGDVIQLSEENEADSVQRLLELYTFSNALAQSVKLSIWEASLANFVHSIEQVTEDLRHGRKISMSRRDVLMKTGELFSLRHLINLSSDLLDTPDFYWDRSGLEKCYMSLFNYLNVSRRTKVMNERLSHCCELTELLSSQLNDAHHTRLEVMIIVLILVEVVFEIVHYAERYLDKNSQETEESAVDDTKKQLAPVPAAAHS